MHSNPHYPKEITLYLLCIAGLADIVNLELKKNQIEGEILDKRNLKKSRSYHF